jgi:hypothetical protein
MNLNIPKKVNSISNEVHNHQVRLDDTKTAKFARVREVLGGYSQQELLEILVDKAIEAYYDGKEPMMDSLPRTFSNKISIQQLRDILGIDKVS